MQMDLAMDEKALNDIIDSPAYSGIINSCGWPITKMITVHSRAEFIHRLIYHEVVGKRSCAVSAFKEGMSILGMCEAIRKNKEIMKPLFVYYDSPLTADTILKLIEWEEVDKEGVADAKEFFIEYLKAKEGSTGKNDYNHVIRRM